jgi:hypothetical protein
MCPVIAFAISGWLTCVGGSNPPPLTDNVIAKMPPMVTVLDHETGENYCVPSSAVRFAYDNLGDIATEVKPYFRAHSVRCE